MIFTDLREELFARGTDYLEEDAAGIARADRWLNQGYREILNLHAWRFLHAFVLGTEGAGTAAVPDLRRIRYVTNTDGVTPGIPGHPLQPTTDEDLVDEGQDLAQTGTPETFYVATNNIIVAHPVGGTIRVDYVKRVPPMSGTDEPVFDEEYHPIIVDKAMVKAYVDSDNFEAAAALKLEINEQLNAMAEDYMLAERQVQFLKPTGLDG